MSLETGDAVGAGAFETAPGVTPPSSPHGRPEFLSDVVVEMGFVSREDAEEAVDRSRLVGRRPEELLIEAGELSEEQLARATAERNGMAFVDLAEFPIDERAQSLVDSETARRYRAAPIAFDSDGAVVVALADPLDGLAVSDIAVITKSEVRPAVAPPSAIDAMVATIPFRRPVKLSEDEPGETKAADLELGAWDLASTITSPASAGEPRPAGEPGAPRPSGAPGELRARIADLVSAAVEEAVDSEAERLARELADATSALETLEADLSGERTLRGEAESELTLSREQLDASEERARRLQTERDEAIAARERIETERDEAIAARERLETDLREAIAARERLEAERGEAVAELERLGGASDEAMAELERLRSEREQLRLAAADGASATERERARRAEIETRLGDGLTTATRSSAELEQSLHGLDSAIARAREAADRISAVHRELGDQIEPEPTH